jgi:hypothetical protein
VSALSQKVIVVAWQNHSILVQGTDQRGLIRSMGLNRNRLEPNQTDGNKIAVKQTGVVAVRHEMKLLGLIGQFE